MSQLRFVFPITFAFIIVLASGFPSVSAPTATPVLSAFGTATVDGIVSPGEYGSSIGPITQGAYTFTIYETNNPENDYYAFIINDLTNDGTQDQLFIYFDNLDDGVVPQFTDPNLLIYEDALEATGGGTFFDRYYGMISGAFNAPADSIQNGGASRTFTVGQGYVYEIVHPLNSGDNRDYSLSTGSTVGWCIMYLDDNGGGVDGLVNYPSGSWASAGSGDASKYASVMKTGLAQLVLSPEGLDVPVGSTFTVDVLINLQGNPGDYTLEGFDFYVRWDTNYIQYEDRAGTYRGWAVEHDAQESANTYHFALEKDSASSWGGGLVWLSLMFRCVAVGPSQICAYGGEDPLVRDERLGPTHEQLIPTGIDPDSMTVNQHLPAPPTGPGAYVGGEVFTANKAVIVAPYLIGILSVVAVTAVLVKRRRT